jgi:uncharacterized protein
VQILTLRSYIVSFSIDRSKKGVSKMFIGRREELSLLRKLVSNKKPSIAVVYGRRRIGKSELIRKALTGTNALFFEGLENKPKRVQLDNFVFQLMAQDPKKVHRSKIRTWREALFLLRPILKKRPSCVVLDEFQWMANYRSDIVADLKMVWDQYLSDIPGVSLILCGSIASFMTTKVVKSNALYGRTDRVIHLEGFNIKETAQMLPNRGLDEVVDAQMYLGGVPKYLELASEESSIQLAMKELAFSKNGYLTGEYDRIFVSHFGKNGDYEKIVVELAKHPYGLLRKQLSQNASINAGGYLSKLLMNLESAGFISSVPPVDKDHNSKQTKYFLSDAYLSFYFNFIVPNRKKIRSVSHGKRIFSGLKQSGSFHSWKGRAFELLCIDHAPWLAEILGFSGIDYSYGPYFQSRKKGTKGVQIDLMFARSDNVITLCEMKCSKAPLGTKVMEEVELKVQIIKKAFPRKTIQRVLVIHGRPSKELEGAGYFYRIINTRELLDSR